MWPILTNNISWVWTLIWTVILTVLLFGNLPLMWRVIIPWAQRWLDRCAGRIRLAPSTQVVRVLTKV